MPLLSHKVLTNKGCCVFIPFDIDSVLRILYYIYLYLKREIIARHCSRFLHENDIL